jgi:hypothetical protein
MRVAVFVCGSIELFAPCMVLCRLRCWRHFRISCDYLQEYGYHHCARGVGGILDRLRLATYLQENSLN